MKRKKGNNLKQKQILKTRIPGLQKKSSITHPKLTPEQTMEFIENFKMTIFAADHKGASKAISLRVPQSLLAAFKLKALSENKPYQAIIKKLMIEYLNKNYSNLS